MPDLHKRTTTRRMNRRNGRMACKRLRREVEELVSQIPWLDDPERFDRLAQAIRKTHQLQIRQQFQQAFDQLNKLFAPKASK